MKKKTLRREKGKVDGFVMFLNKLLPVLIIFIMASAMCKAEQTQYISSQCVNKENIVDFKDEFAYDFIIKIFTHFIDHLPFEKRWSSNFGAEIEDYFLQKVPPELSRFEKDISFAGEFLRFQFEDILNKDNAAYSIDIYLLPIKSVSCKFDNHRQIKLIDLSSEAHVKECAVRLNILNFDNGRGIIPLNFYFGITRMNSGILRLEYYEFLTNNKLALCGHIPEPKNISQKILEKYSKWLLEQLPKYEKVQKSVE